MYQKGLLWEWVQRGYRDGEVPWSALCKRENQEIQFYNSDQYSGLKMGEAGDITPSVRLNSCGPGDHSCKPQSLKSQEPEAAMFMWKKRKREKR